MREGKQGWPAVFLLAAQVHTLLMKSTKPAKTRPPDNPPSMAANQPPGGVNGPIVTEIIRSSTLHSLPPNK